MEITLQLGSHTLDVTLACHPELDYLGRGVLVPEVCGVWVLKGERARKLAKPSAKLCKAILAIVAKLPRE